MKLLLTGLPGAGKTTLIQHVITLKKEAFWVVSAEIRDDTGQRLGFNAATSTGLKGTFAHKRAITSETQIGDYKIDVAALDRLFTGPIRAAMRSKQLLIVDEIGRMQMLSPQFAEVVRDLLASDQNVIATIRYGDDWTHELTDRNDVLLLVLTPTNRELAKTVVEAMIGAEINISKLTPAQQQTLAQLSKNYCAHDNLLQLKKLYKNAIKYVAEQRIHQKSDHEFVVEGDHGGHEVASLKNGWACDCDLFNGRGQFAHKAGECSHVQSVKLFSAGAGA